MFVLENWQETIKGIPPLLIQNLLVSQIHRHPPIYCHIWYLLKTTKKNRKTWFNSKQKTITLLIEYNENTTSNFKHFHSWPYWISRIIHISQEENLFKEVVVAHKHQASGLICRSVLEKIYAFITIADKNQE